MLNEQIPILALIEESPAFAAIKDSFTEEEWIALGETPFFSYLKDLVSHSHAELRAFTFVRACEEKKRTALVNQKELTFQSLIDAVLLKIKASVPAWVRKHPITTGWWYLFSTEEWFTLEKTNFKNYMKHQKNWPVLEISLSCLYIMRLTMPAVSFECIVSAIIGSNTMRCILNNVPLFYDGVCDPCWANTEETQQVLRKLTKEEITLLDSSGFCDYSEKDLQDPHLALMIFTVVKTLSIMKETYPSFLLEDSANTIRFVYDLFGPDIKPTYPFTSVRPEEVVRTPSPLPLPPTVTGTLCKVGKFAHPAATAAPTVRNNTVQYAWM